MRILVTGATGYIGERLVEALRDKEWVERIVGLDIRESPLRHPKLRFLARDIREPLDDLFEPNASTPSPISPSSCHPSTTRASWRTSTRAASGIPSRLQLGPGSDRSCTPAPPRRMGFTPTTTTPDEESPLRGNDDLTYSKNKRENEEIIREFRSAHPEIIISNLRPCVVIGPRWINPLATHMSSKLVMLPCKTAPTQFVHQDDWST